MASTSSQGCSPFPQSLSQLLEVPQADACSLLLQDPWEEAAVVAAVAAAAISISAWRNRLMEKWFLPVREKSKYLVQERRTLPTPCSPWAGRGTGQRGPERRLQSVPSRISLLPVPGSACFSFCSFSCFLLSVVVQEATGLCMVAVPSIKNHISFHKCLLVKHPVVFWGDGGSDIQF